MTTATEREATFLASLDARVAGILDTCSRCGRCVEVCPTATPAGLDTSEPGAIVDDVLAILRGAGDADSRGARWAETCTGSGTCITACEDGVNPRFMLAMARLKLGERANEEERRAKGRAGFTTMSEGVKVLSRLQRPVTWVSEVTRSASAVTHREPPEVVMYLGCNVMKTPHIALLCLDVLDRIGARYTVAGGPANCCGVIQFRAGDPRAGGRVGTNSLAGFASTGAGSVLTWCPTCNIQMGEIVMPAASESAIGLQHVVPYIADHLDRLTPHFVHRVERRVALHEHPGVPGVTEAVLKILGAIPGVTVVDLGQPRVGYMCNSLNPVPAYKRALHARELDAARDAGVDALVGVYHACHRELCAHERDMPFRVVNFLELVGEAMGVERPDLLKRWKMMQDVDRVVAEVGATAEAAGLDIESVRTVLVATLLGEQPLPLRSTAS